MHKLLTGVLSGGVVALGSTIGLWNHLHKLEDKNKLVAHCTTAKIPLISHPLPNRNIDKKNQAISESRKFIEQLMLEQGVPGAQVAVSRNGRLIWSEGIGLADVENSVACTTKSVMRVASISKPLCSVGLFKLWEKGLVDLDAPIQTYVPSFPEKCWDGEKVVVTTRQLLCHMSGIRHYKKKGLEKNFYC